MFQAEIKRRDQGYTLLELLVVLAIISLAVSLTPNVYARLVPAYQARQFSNELVNTLRTLREEAKQSGITQWIEVGETEQTLLLSSGNLRPPYGIVLSYSAEGAVEVEAEGRIYFYPNGTATGGSVGIVRDKYRVEVRVDWISGAVRIVE